MMTCQQKIKGKNILKKLRMSSRKYYANNNNNRKTGKSFENEK